MNEIKIMATQHELFEKIIKIYPTPNWKIDVIERISTKSTTQSQIQIKK